MKDKTPMFDAAEAATSPNQLTARHKAGLPDPALPPAGRNFKLADPELPEEENAINIEGEELPNDLHKCHALLLKVSAAFQNIEFTATRAEKIAARARLDRVARHWHKIQQGQTAISIDANDMAIIQEGRKRMAEGVESELTALANKFPHVQAVIDNHRSKTQS